MSHRLSRICEKPHLVRSGAESRGRAERSQAGGSGADLRWHARYCGEVPDVGFEEAHAVLACLAGLTGRRPKPAAAALAELVHRHGLERAREALIRGLGESVVGSGVPFAE